MSLFRSKHCRHGSVTCSQHRLCKAGLARKTSVTGHVFREQQLLHIFFLLWRRQPTVFLSPKYQYHYHFQRWTVILLLVRMAESLQQQSCIGCMTEGRTDAFPTGLLSLLLIKQTHSFCLLLCLSQIPTKYCCECQKSIYVLFPPHLLHHTEQVAQGILAFFQHSLCLHAAFMHLVPDSVSTPHPVLFLVSGKKSTTKAEQPYRALCSSTPLMLVPWTVCQHRRNTKDKEALIDNNTGYWRHNFQDINCSEQITQRLFPATGPKDTEEDHITFIKCGINANQTKKLALIMPIRSAHLF